MKKCQWGKGQNKEEQRRKGEKRETEEGGKRKKKGSIHRQFCWCFFISNLTVPYPTPLALSVTVFSRIFESYIMTEKQQDFVKLSLTPYKMQLLLFVFMSIVCTIKQKVPTDQIM